MNPAQDVLGQLAGLGARVYAKGNRLVLRAGATAIPRRLVARARQDRSLILAALRSGGTRAVGRVENASVAANWQEFCAERASIRQYVAGYSRPEAEMLAWSDTLHAWHMMYGKRPARSKCAGCDQFLGPDVLVLPDGAAVHFSTLHCLSRYGDRWRSAAERALADMGLVPPGAEHAEEQPE